MLEIKVDLIPFGNESKRETLDKLIIINTGNNRNRPVKGDYICKCGDKSFEIKNHIREEGYWRLLQKCIGKLVNERKREST